MKLIVEGMTCGHCIRAITQALQALDRSAQVTVDLATRTVVVTGNIGAAAASAAVEAAGYTVISIEPDQPASPGTLPDWCRTVDLVQGSGPTYPSAHGSR